MELRSAQLLLISSVSRENSRKLNHSEPVAAFYLAHMGAIIQHLGLHTQLSDERLPQQEIVRQAP